MTLAIAYRGPDDSGIWIDDNVGVGMGHRRLSVVDLSPAGHQPMISASGRFVMVFNGEIYNHLKLRRQLADANELLADWRGYSDTETLLACIEAWGVDATLKNCVGMFAFALWDRKEQCLFLARDRLGEKPLYYGWQGDTFLFGSELAALKQHPEFKAEINKEAVTLLLRHNCVPTPYSIYKGISKLEPGCLLTVSVASSEPILRRYWSAQDVALKGVLNPFAGTLDEALAQLEHLVMDSIGQQMVADVPLGAFLSGGIDSSTVVALMQAQSSQPVKTFTIGFQESGYNEAKHAKAVAQFLGTEHAELYVTAQEAMEVIPQLPELYCEPFSDSSQIPTFLVCQLARKHVTVSLSGDAGDELFCGYNRYRMTNKLWHKLSLLPPPLRATVSKSITSISPGGWDNLAKYVPGAQRSNNIGDKLHKGAGVLASRSIDELYMGLVSHHRDPAALLIDGREPSTFLTDNLPALLELGNVERMMLLDQMTYLSDDILVKLDRAAMAVSLETRAPFLDHRIVEFVWTLPLSIKLKDGQSKWPLRQILSRYVPRELIDRPKMGFGIPLHDWLRGPLREWAEELINGNRLRREGIFEPEPVRVLWSEHLIGKRNWASILWNILMFQAWLEVQQ